MTTGVSARADVDDRHLYSTPVSVQSQADTTTAESVSRDSEAATLDSYCKEEAVATRMTRPRGSIDWTGNGSSMSCAWLIDVTSSGQGGLVLQFDTVSLQRWANSAAEEEEEDEDEDVDDDDTVTVYQGLRPLPGNRLRRVQGYLPSAPVLVPSPLALVTVVAHRHATAAGQQAAETPEGRAESRFSLKYEAHRVTELPPPMASGRYNCSQPYAVPTALRCDMVEQCQDGEDERDYDCSYRHADCGARDWIPYGNYCLAFVFQDSSRPLTPVTAKSECRARFGRQSWLAALPDSEGKQLAARLTSLAGYDDVVVGLKKARLHKAELSHLYRFLWVWDFEGVLELEGPLLSLQGPALNCATLRVTPGAVYLNPVKCSRALLRAGYSCMKVKEGLGGSRFVPWIRETKALTYPAVSQPLERPPTKTCPDGSLVLQFTRCPFPFFEPDTIGQSVDGRYNAQVRRFPCDNKYWVHYTVTCDGRDDCGDESDEQYCFLGSFRFPKDLYYMCKTTHELVLAENRCDGKADCYDSSDEADCQGCSPGAVYFTELGCLPEAYTGYGLHNYRASPPPTRTSAETADRVARKILGGGGAPRGSPGTRVVTLDGYGRLWVQVNHTTDGGNSCPETHLRCPGGVCLPTYMVVNDERDCPFPYGDDERRDYGLEGVACPGHYRCRGSSLCVHPQQVCDGVYHCPRKDDERYCDLACPPDCTCEGLQYTCDRAFDPELHPFVRYLDLSEALTPPRVDNLDAFPFLRFLNLSSCRLVQPARFPELTLVSVLDISFNRLLYVNILQRGMLTVRYLNVSGNPLVSTLTADRMGELLHEVSQRKLLSLTLAETGMNGVHRQAFENFSNLEFLDISGNPIERFEKATFEGLRDLQRLKADDQRLCCAHAGLYPEAALTCEAPVDELSSCSDLLRSPILRVTLWLQSLVAVAGNAGVFVFRVFAESQQRRASSGYPVLVINLCAADLLMGVYMVIIGAADARFHGRYLWEGDAWTRSGQCRAAGFLALLSSEVSAFVICVITADRLLVLRFPFKHGLHLTARSAAAVCGAAWTVGALLAAVPLLPATRHWRFYSQTGICLPLPVTRRHFPGQAYSFAVFVGLNFVLFLLIGAGQLCIYRTIRSSSSSSSASSAEDGSGQRRRRRQDAAIARRLFLVVLTDLCCWLPVGVMGLLAVSGTPIPGEVDVVTAVFLLPLNSALNPFLYTLNAVLRKRGERREERRLQRTMKRLHAELFAWPDDKVAELVRYGEAALRRSRSDPTAAAASTSEDRDRERERGRGEPGDSSPRVGAERPASTSNVNTVDESLSC